MSHPPITIHRDPIGLAAERLVAHGITRLPVVDAAGRLVGMVSRLDLLRQVMDVAPTRPPARPRPRDGRLAGEVMRSDMPLVQEETDLAGVIASFLASGEHRVIVVDATGAPVGISATATWSGASNPPTAGSTGSAARLGRPPLVSISARELMSPGVETILAGTSVVEAVRRMVSAQRKWLVVVDAAGKPVGLIDREIALHALVR